MKSYFTNTRVLRVLPNNESYRIIPYRDGKYRLVPATIRKTKEEMLDAVVNSIQKRLLTERFSEPIFSSDYGVNWDKFIGVTFDQSVRAELEFEVRQCVMCVNNVEDCRVNVSQSTQVTRRSIQETEEVPTGICDIYLREVTEDRDQQVIIIKSVKEVTGLSLEQSLELVSKVAAGGAPELLVQDATPEQQESCRNTFLTTENSGVNLTPAEVDRCLEFRDHTRTNHITKDLGTFRQNVIRIDVEVKIENLGEASLAVSKEV